MAGLLTELVVTAVVGLRVVLSLLPGEHRNGEAPATTYSTNSHRMHVHKQILATWTPTGSVGWSLDQINRDPTLLPGYQLHYTLTDSQVCEADHEIGLDLDYSTHNVI